MHRDGVETWILTTQLLWWLHPETLKIGEVFLFKMLRDARGSGQSPSTPPYPTFPPHSPYLRRISPPGSPNPNKKCCYEHKDLYPKESFLCCCYSCPGRSSASILATVGVCCLVLGYTILGAFVFMALEGGYFHETAVAASKTNPRRDTNIVDELRSQTVDRLWSITENLNILYRENWTRLAADEVFEFQQALFRALRGTSSAYVSSSGGTLFYSHNTHRWSFSSSFLYSLTLITTIGKWCLKYFIRLGSFSR